MSAHPLLWEVLSTTVNAQNEVEALAMELVKRGQPKLAAALVAAAFEFHAAIEVHKEEIMKILPRPANIPAAAAPPARIASNLALPHSSSSAGASYTVKALSASTPATKRSAAVADETEDSSSTSEKKKEDAKKPRTEESSVRTVKGKVGRPRKHPLPETKDGKEKKQPKQHEEKK